MVEIPLRIGASHRFPTPEQARVAYSDFAREVLTGVPIFDQMDEAMQKSVIIHTTGVITSILFKHGRRLTSISPDLAWDSLNEAYLRGVEQESAFGSFKRALGQSAERVFKMAYAMLEAKINTKQEFIESGKVRDPLRGLRDWMISVKDSAEDIEETEIVDPPLPNELIEFTGGK
jgi:hypothetical protein